MLRVQPFCQPIIHSGISLLPCFALHCGLSAAAFISSHFPAIRRPTGIQPYFHSRLYRKRAVRCQRNMGLTRAAFSGRIGERLSQSETLDCSDVLGRRRAWKKGDSGFTPSRPKPTNERLRLIRARPRSVIICRKRTCGSLSAKGMPLFVAAYVRGGIATKRKAASSSAATRLQRIRKSALG
jgi:hypothetical protein